MYLHVKPKDSIPCSLLLPWGAVGSGLQPLSVQKTLSENEVAAEKKSCELHVAPESFAMIVTTSAARPKPQP